LKGNGEGFVNNIDARIILQMFTHQGKNGMMIKLNTHNDLVNLHFSQDLKLANVFLTLHYAPGRIPCHILSYITFHM
jgi:hypothetical protein